MGGSLLHLPLLGGPGAVNKLLVVHRLLKDRDPFQLHMQSSPKAGGCQRVARSRRMIHFHRAPCALFVDESCVQKQPSLNCSNIVLRSHDCSGDRPARNPKQTLKSLFRVRVWRLWSLV